MKTETVFHRCDEHAKLRAEMRLRKQAAMLGFQIILQNPKRVVDTLVP